MKKQKKENRKTENKIIIIKYQNRCQNKSDKKEVYFTKPYSRKECKVVFIVFSFLGINFFHNKRKVRRKTIFQTLSV